MRAGRDPVAKDLGGALDSESPARSGDGRPARDADTGQPLHMLLPNPPSMSALSASSAGCSSTHTVSGQVQRRAARAAAEQQQAP